ncbi:sensor histidine kinase [Asanoa sp. NPDC049573]|uniref:sensor histidine kinase n=1 Tax=Asanoa sp. NPDC049573 TaxID=3155396 RepID=UPI0034389370
MTVAGEGSDRRFDRVTHLIPYPTLAVAAAIVVLEGDRGAVSLGLVVATVVWFALPELTAEGRAWSFARPPGTWGIVHFAGFLTLYAALVAVNGWFGICAIAGYVYAVLLRPLWLAGIALAATAVVTATSWRGGLPEGLPNGSSADAVAFGAAVGFNVLTAGAFSYFGYAQEQQSRKRQRMVTELAEANRKLSAALAENAGLHAQLVGAAREAGVLDERARMARELHDTLAQGLIGIVTQLEAAGSGELERHVDAALALARDSLTATRRSMHAMRPAELEGARLPDALASLAGAWSSASAVPAGLTTTGAVRDLHPEVELALLRAAQEALANVSKHARAGKVGITLSYMDDVVTLDVRDDGVGFEPGAGLRDGAFGLVAMRQRVERLGGRVEIEAEPGGGVAVAVSVPAATQAAGDEEETA